MSQGLMEIIHKTFNDSVRVSMFSKLRTNNPVLDTIITTLVLTFMSYIVQFAYQKDVLSTLSEIDWRNNWSEKLKSIFYRKNAIIMSGRKNITSSAYGNQRLLLICSNSFKAVCQDITDNLYDNPSIREITEYFNIENSNKDQDDDNQNDYRNNGRNKSGLESTYKHNPYIVSQNSHFVFCEKWKIFATAELHTEKNSEKDHDETHKCETIKISLYSYETSIAEMQKYIVELTDKYNTMIEQSRNNQRFIYTLYKTKFDDYKYECWNEHLFESSRTFDNMFFDHKEEILNQIEFWENNRDWYYEMGIPYTLGIGLKGPPGTGKTSFLKALANKTRRHLVKLSLKLIKTSRQLEDFFYEDRYNSNNKKYSVDFSKKIIYIDDIDCIGDIVKKRDENDNSFNRATKSTPELNVEGFVQTLLENVVSVSADDAKMDNKTTNHGNISKTGNIVSSALKMPEEDPLALDDILNILDGVRETPDRIFVIASNYWHLLDDALIRCGRIDRVIHLGYVSHNTLRQMYHRFYKMYIDETKLVKIKAEFYSPAEITNIFTNCKNDPERFMARLMENVKI